MGMRAFGLTYCLSPAPKRTKLTYNCTELNLPKLCSAKKQRREKCLKLL